MHNIRDFPAVEKSSGKFLFRDNFSHSVEIAIQEPGQLLRADPDRPPAEGVPMKQTERYCQCQRRALVPPSRRHLLRMRRGYIFRKGHDLCRQCFRRALATAIRLAA
jgi:hypothetical protein